MSLTTPPDAQLITERKLTPTPTAKVHRRMPPPLPDVLRGKAGHAAEVLDLVPSRSTREDATNLVNAMEAAASRLESRAPELTGALLGAWRTDGAGWVVGHRGHALEPLSICDLMGHIHEVDPESLVLYVEGGISTDYASPEAVSYAMDRAVQAYEGSWVENLDLDGWMAELRDRLIIGHAFPELMVERALARYYVPF